MSDQPADTPPEPAHREFRHRSAPGSVPGTIVNDPTGVATVLHAMRYNHESVDEWSKASVDEINNIRAGEGVVWINAIGLANADLIAQIGQEFGLHPLSLEDVVHVHQRSKVEEYDDHLFLIVRRPVMHIELQFEQIAIFIGKNYVITFQEHAGNSLKGVAERIRFGRGNIREKGADYLGYAIIDSVIDGYYPISEHYSTELEELEDSIELGSGPNVLHVLHRIRRDLLRLRRHLQPHRDMINSLLRDRFKEIGPDALVYLRDTYDHVINVLEVVDGLREISGDLREFHYSQVSQKTNDAMKVLTVISTVFLPMTFITGLYGMNFDPNVSRWNMPELDWKYGYPMALVFMTLPTTILLFYFYRRGWLKWK